MTPLFFSFINPINTLNKAETVQQLFSLLICILDQIFDASWCMYCGADGLTIGFWCLIGHESKKAKVTEMLKITEALKGEMKV
jgi:hypothetical protein